MGGRRERMQYVLRSVLLPPLLPLLRTVRSEGGRTEGGPSFGGEGGGCFIYFSFLLYNFVINCLVTCIFRVLGKKYIPIITVSKIKPKKGTIN